MVSEMLVEAFRSELCDEWDDFVDRVAPGQLLVTRRFLSYHRDRFSDRSLIFRNAKGSILAVLPLAEQPSALPGDDRTIASHPGATYGGLLTLPGLDPVQFEEILGAAIEVMRSQNFSRFIYKPIPYIYSNIPSQEDLYFLWKMGFVVSRRTLSECIDIQNRRKPSDRRVRALKRAKSQNCQIYEGEDAVTRLWPVVVETLWRRHHVRPVHTLDEMKELTRLFPGNIECICALISDETVAGLVLFHSKMVTHVQYSVTNLAGAQIGAMDYLIESAISAAKIRNSRYFDFGISTDSSGLFLNQGLHKFKMEFGSGTVVYDTYLREI